MSDQEKQSLIENFATVAGVDGERARFFLDLSGWNLDVALTNFFDTNNESDSEMVVEPRAPTPPRGTEPMAKPQPAKPSGHAAQGRPGTKPPSTSSRIASLSTLKNAHEDSESDEDNDDEEGQAYYAGGSERSGQQIIGPPKKKGDAGSLISGLFSAAKRHGAEEVEPSSSASSSSGPHVAPFQGRAYRLGGPSDESEVIEGPRQVQRRTVDLVLKLWKNGFSLNDGPLREFSDPQNIEFLNSIKRNEMPRELLEQSRNGEINLSMEDHHGEDYAAPKKAAQAFAGAGHRLGSPTDAVVVSSDAAASANVSSASSSSASSSAAAAEASAASAVSVDANQPTTSLQIRLADGSRLIAKFNHSHRVSDVRRYIVTARPQLAGSSFVLMTTFPNKELADETQTLANANLVNAVLVVKLK